MVQGHVDTAITLVQRQPDPPNSLLLTFKVPEPLDPSNPSSDFLRYIIPKGYVCLNGTSLTVINVDRKERTFNVMLIAYTQNMVNLPNVEVGGRVNLEVDEVGKYIDTVVRGFLLGGDSSVNAEGGLLKEMVKSVVNDVLSEKLEELKLK
jgi:riboflavin synthase